MIIFKNGMIALGLLAWMGVPLTLTWAERAKTDSKEEKIPLILTLPKPMFIGTPKDVRSTNLERPSGKKRPVFMIPKGVTNLAAGRPVTSSDKDPIIGTMEQLIDGDKEGVDWSYVELGPDLQWVQIDLGKKARIHAILLWHFHAQARVYHDVIVKTADDPDFITNVQTVYNNDHDNSAGLGIGKDKEYVETYEGRLMVAKGVNGRYVRFYSKGNTSNDLNHYVEIEVYGKPAK